MKQKHPSVLTRYPLASGVVALGLFVLLTAFVPLMNSLKQITYTIEDKSNLSVGGTTNVNSFDCKCKEKFGKSTASVSYDPSGQFITFEQASLSMRTSSLDCDNSKMNDDLQEAMEAEEYPFINVKLHNAQIVEGSIEKAGETAKLKANAVITIRNVSHMVVLDIKASRLSNEQYRFVSSHKLKMTDYGIEPPTALFGLIKVRNTISINFDLYTRTTD